MLYLDFTWNLDSTGILFDRELDIKKLGWAAGDVFRLVEEDGRMKLIKIIEEK